MSRLSIAASAAALLAAFVLAVPTQAFWSSPEVGGPLGFTTPRVDPMTGEWSSQIWPAVASSGAVSLAVWSEQDVAGEGDIWAARIAPDGTVLDPDGFPIHVGPGDQRVPGVVWDGLGFFVIWEDRLVDYGDVYGIHVTAEGALLDPAPLAIATGPGQHGYPSLAFGGDDYLVAWHGPDSTIRLTAVSRAGFVYSPGGIPIVDAPEMQGYPNVAYAPASETFLVVWGDRRRTPTDWSQPGSFEWPPFDVYGMRLRLDAASAPVLLDSLTDSLPIHVGAQCERRNKVASDGSAFLVVASCVDGPGTWNGADVRMTPFFHRVGADGVVSPGRAAALGAVDAWGARVAWAGTSYVVSWVDGAAATPELRAARVSAGGALLDPSATLVASGVRFRLEPPPPDGRLLFSSHGALAATGSGTALAAYTREIGVDGPSRLAVRLLDLEPDALPAQEIREWALPQTDTLLQIAVADGVVFFLSYPPALGRLDTATGALTTWPLPITITSPGDVLIDAEGAIWLTDIGGSQIARFDPATGELTEWRLPSPARRLAAAPDGTIWYPFMSSYVDAGFGRLDPRTDVATEWLVETYNGVDSIALAPDGRVFTQVWGSVGADNAVVALDPATGVLTRWAIPWTATVQSAFDASGALFFGDVAGRAARLDVATGLLTAWPAHDAVGWAIDSATFDLLGRWVFTGERGVVGLDPSARGEESAIEPTVASTFPIQLLAWRTSVAAAPAEFVVVPTTRAVAVTRIGPFTEYAVGQGPREISADAAGDLYWSDQVRVAIGSIQASGRIAVAKVGSGSGMITSTPPGIACGDDCGGAFPPGSSVTLVAEAAAGSVFTEWSGACAGTGPCVVPVLGAAEVTARFERQWTVSVSRLGAGSGRVTSAPAGVDCGGTCSAAWTQGTTVTLTAEPADGSVFTGWSGACSGTGACSVTLNAAKSVGATFQPSTYPVKLSPTASGGGRVVGAVGGTTVLDCTTAGAACSCAVGSGCGATVAYGARVSLTATADASSLFRTWTTTCTGTGECLLTMNSAKTLGVRFEPGAYPLSMTVAGSGQGTVRATDASAPPPAELFTCTEGTCSSPVPNGHAVTLEAVAGEGSIFAGWTGPSCEATTSTCSVTMTAARSATATFAPAVVPLTIAPVGAGIGTVTGILGGQPISCTSGSPEGCSVPVPWSASLELVAAPAAGSVFKRWEGVAGCDGAPTCNVTLVDAKTVTARFEPAAYTVTLSLRGTGTGSVLRLGAIACAKPTSEVATCGFSAGNGATVTLDAAAGAAATFRGWAVVCTGTGQCSFVANSDKTVWATFDPSP